jgi:hypothetical protein
MGVGARRGAAAAGTLVVAARSTWPQAYSHSTRPWRGGRRPVCPTPWAAGLQEIWWFTDYQHTLGVSTVDVIGNE